MKCLTKIAVFLLSVAVIQANAQSAPKSQGGGAQETQARGFWIDPSTALMWAGKDNGKDVSWKNAVKYCRSLRLAGYSDWRLATLAELGAIYDRSANAPGLAGSGKDNLFTYHVKGNLFLTGDEWSSEPRYDDRGHPTGYAWYFDFNEGRSDNDQAGSLTPILSCVRCVCAVPGNKCRKPLFFPILPKGGELVFAQNPAGPQSRNL
ncbi:MAG: DUF1566 domain-containing protein [Terriglobales bacterium]